MPNFARKFGDEVTLHENNGILDFNMVKHGDYIRGNGDRSIGDYVVCKFNGELKFISLMHNDVGGSGYGSIPLCVTKYIEDPVDFYKSIKDFLFEIELDGRFIKKYNIEDPCGFICIDTD